MKNAWRGPTEFCLLPIAFMLCTPVFAQDAPDSSVIRAVHRLDEISGSWTAEWELPLVRRIERGAASAQTAARQMAMSEDPEVRRRAIEALSNGPDSPPLRDLLWALGDEDAGVRAVALKKIAPRSPTALLEGALDILLENDEASVYALDRALPSLPAGVGDEFARIFKDKSQPVPLRRAAAYALGKLRTPGIASALADGTGEAEVTLAESCALALYGLRDTRTIPMWTRLVQHHDLNISWLAIRALAELGGHDAFLVLAEAANGTLEVAPQLVPIAINSLGAWPLADAIPALIEVMARNAGYRQVAGAVLRTRTGVPLGDKADEWREWYVNGLPEPVEQAPLTEDAPTELLQMVEFVPPDLRGRGF